jgi:hypothetical protein
MIQRGYDFLFLQVTFTFVYYYVVMSPQEKCVLPKCAITDASGHYIVKINGAILSLAPDFLNEHKSIALCVPCLCIKECFILTWYTNICSFACVGSSYKYRTALSHLSQCETN